MNLRELRARGAAIVRLAAKGQLGLDLGFPLADVIQEMERDTADPTILRAAIRRLNWGG